MADFWEGYRRNGPHRFKELSTGNEVWFDPLAARMALVTGPSLRVYEGEVVGRLRTRLEEVAREAEMLARGPGPEHGVPGPAVRAEAGLCAA